MKRKLASIQKVININPIEGADRIEHVKVLGWWVVSKKGEFSIGDLCVYFEVDSIVPEKEWSEFLRNKNFRLKTIKLRGALSQGLVVPLSIDDRLSKFSEGDDVTELLEVKKYEPVLPNVQNMAGAFISSVPKTDEMRIQSVPEVIEEIKGKEFYATIKLDGTSATYAKFNGEFYVCSRNWRIKEGNNRYWRMAKKYNLEQIIPDNVSLQGEICGPGIQGNKLSISQEDIFFFNYFKIGEGYKNYNTLNKFCSKCNLKPVPLFMVVTGEDAKTFDHNIDKWIERAKGEYGHDLDIWFDRQKNIKVHQREGLVIRPVEEVYSRILKGRLSFKVINNNFLLKEK